MVRLRLAHAIVLRVYLNVSRAPIAVARDGRVYLGRRVRRTGGYILAGIGRYASGLRGRNR